MYRTLLSTLCLFSLVACAPQPYIVDGKVVPRVRLGYTDRNYFAVQHNNAPPEQRGPSSGLRTYGGAIAGRICGVDVVYEAYHRGRHLDVLGFVASADEIERGSQARSLIANIRIQDRWSLDGGMRDFTGSVGRTAEGADDLTNRSPVVDFTLSQTILRGRIGVRLYNLRAKDDAYEGVMVLAGKPYQFKLKGRGRLWSMSAADQAAVLPLMMSCAHVERFDLPRPVLDVDLDPPSKG
ncbi:MAG TPA: hypothetical protein VH877_19025 [Polyangia bacterium]|nr:hypothetical protein [Polyangia bacterium]